MNHFFKYKYNDTWITIREEHNMYYVVSPCDLSVIVLTKIQAYILHKLNIEGYSEKELKTYYFPNDATLQNAITIFLKNAHEMNLA